MRSARTALSIVLALLATGCAQSISYRLKDVPVISQSPFTSYTLTVKEFTDVRRPVDQVKSQWRSPYAARLVARNGEDWFYNSDELYKNNVAAPWITEMLAKHLTASKLFRDVKVSADGSSDTDFLLDGRIEKFEALKEAGYSKLTQIGQLFGVLGALATAGVESQYEATTKLSELHLRYVKTQTVVWNGEAEATIGGSDYADPYGLSVYLKANESLKKAVEDLIRKLGQAEFRGHDVIDRSD